MKKFKTRLLLFLFCWISATGTHAYADNYPVNNKIHVQHYLFEIRFSDKTNEINAVASIRILFKEAGVRQVRLDLTNHTGNTPGKGMTVTSVTVDGKEIQYLHSENALTLPLNEAPSPQSEKVFIIHYQGEPADGLHIGPTKYGDRSFFSDNWPNKARNWLPTIDHPSNKSTCEFILKTPLGYKAVSNGLLLEESILNDSTLLTHWKQSVPIAPWLFTIGIAKFAVQYVDEFKGKSIQSWVYAKDRDAGFYDFAEPTKEVLAFFSDYVGPYAYEKLANIESPVVSGGMEAASAIGYSEKLINGKRDSRTRNVVIHELAHQWFGNAVTENNWDNAWLSESFATCFTLLFIEHKYGKAEYKSELAKAKKIFEDFYKKDTSFKIVASRTAEEEPVTNYAVTYQKGAWVLLMLREKIGEPAFRKGIQSYYKNHFNLNATTEDFIREMESVSHQDLRAYFDQWLHRSGEINIRAIWSYDAAKKKLIIDLHQPPQKDKQYEFQLEIGITSSANGSQTIRKYTIHPETTRLSIPCKEMPVTVALDPNKKLLANMVINEMGKE